MERTFDRLVEFDERSRSFSIRETLRADEPRSYSWGCTKWLDQGKEGACVGFAWAHEASAQPVSRRLSAYDAVAIYHRARHLDNLSSHASGTSVLAGAKAMIERGLLREYRWAFGLQDVLVTISQYGPVVFGLNWYEGMRNPDAEGFVHVEDGFVGGHAVLGLGVSLKRRAVRLHNSWGRTWGQDGRAWISFDDLERLLYEQGETCVPVVR